MQRLAVSVLVTLFRHEHAGGHVKCWERFARAATRQPELDLTVHFLGDREETVTLSEHVRYRMHPPRLCTRRLALLSQMPDHTDVASYNRSLAGALVGRDVLHATDAFFSFAGTALAVSRRRGIPLVSSIHTDTPSYTRVYTAQIVEQLCGRGWLRRVLVDRWQIDRRAEQRMQRKLERYLRSSTYVTLRRGVDKELFHPAKRDRRWLAQRFGVSGVRQVVLFVGRLSEGKNVRVLVDAIAELPGMHLICAGAGPLRSWIGERLGDRASCPGQLGDAELARVYASADLLAMPSEIEVVSNVVQEALASGLPVIVARRGAEIPPGTGLVVNDDWAVALRTRIDRPAMSRAARAFAEAGLPSWEDVLREDLLPRWQHVAAR
jgi:glycosyltransferase involved in cell wall biosynthesis